MKSQQKKKKNKNYPLVLTERFKYRITLDILWHIPILVTHIHLHVITQKEKNPLVLANRSTKLLLENDFLHKNLQEEMEDIFGHPARYLMENIQSYEELVNEANTVNALYKS